MEGFIKVNGLTTTWKGLVLISGKRVEFTMENSWLIRSTVMDSTNGLMDVNTKAIGKMAFNMVSESSQLTKKTMIKTKLTASGKTANVSPLLTNKKLQKSLKVN